MVFQLKIPHRSFILSFWKCLWVEAETCCFCACLFKCKWAAAPRPFSRLRLCLYNSYFRYSAKQKQLFGVDYDVYHAEIMCLISYKFRYKVFWVHTSEAHAQKAAVTWHVSTKLSLYLIVLKLSNTHVYVKYNTKVTKTVNFVYEGKQLGNKLYVYFRSV